MDESRHGLTVLAKDRDLTPREPVRQCERTAHVVYVYVAIGQAIADLKRRVSQRSREAVPQASGFLEGAEVDNKTRDRRPRPPLGQEVEEQSDGDQHQHDLITPQNTTIDRRSRMRDPRACGDEQNRRKGGCRHHRYQPRLSFRPS